MVSKLATIGRQVIRSASQVVLGLAKKRTVLVHTPKCGGTYVVKQYKIDEKPQIVYVGHRCLSELQLRPRTQVVGLIREPADWYVSYHHFCKKALAEAPQGPANFPPEHPITLFSAAATLTPKEMLRRMSDQELLEKTVKAKTVATIYGRPVEGVYEYMLRTGTGLWSWTMMYHFSRKALGEIEDLTDVIQEAKEIVGRVNFIHQETIDADVERFLGLPRRAGKPINASRDANQQAIDPPILKLTKKMDGEVAVILGDYS